jgi:chromosome segregation ATPase
MAESQLHNAAEDRPEPLRDVRVDAAHSLRRRGQAAPMAVREPAAVALDAAVETADAYAADEELSNADADLALADYDLSDLDLAPEAAASAAEHAASLASRLQARLADVDRREARLNSQEAEFDTRIRRARLWIEQCEADITLRQQQLDEGEQSLAQRQELAVEQLAEAEEIAQRLAELTERERAAEAITIELQLGRTELQTKLDALEFETAGCRSRQLELDEARLRCEQRQRELDRREAKLYTDHEQHSRQRAQLSTDEAAVARREEALVARQKDLDDVQRQLTETASELEFRRAELDREVIQQQQRVNDAAAHERRLQFRQREIETALLRLERLGIVEEKMVELEQQAAAFAVRSAYVDNAEQMLAERQMHLADQQRELESQQLAFENQVTRERRGLAAQAEESRTVADQRNRDLDRREQGLDSREQSLERLADELRANQRETLEMRLAIEETWQQLQGALAPAALSRSIAQVRGKLADQFRLQGDELAERRQELDRIRGELADQVAQIDERRSQLQSWLDQQQAEIEKQATRLAARERTLDEQAKGLRDEEQCWQAEREEYQQQIQDLLSKLRAPSRAA